MNFIHHLSINFIIGGWPGICGPGLQLPLNSSNWFIQILSDIIPGIVVHYPLLLLEHLFVIEKPVQLFYLYCGSKVFS